MRFMLLLVFATLFASCSSSVASVLQAEQERFGATVAGDTTALRQSLHQDLIYIHSNGLEESAQGFVASVASGRIQYQRFEPLQPVHVKPFGKTALADGLVRVHGLYEGSPFTVDLRYTSTYRRKQGRWQLLRWQSLQVE